MVAAGAAMLYVRDARTMAFVVLAAAAVYGMRRVSSSQGGTREAYGLFGVVPLMTRVRADPQVSVSDERGMKEELETAIDSYLRSLSPNSRRPASSHAADYDMHRTRTLSLAETLPAYVGRTCHTIFDRLDKVLVWKRLMQTRGASPSDGANDLATYARLDHANMAAVGSPVQ